MGAVKYVMAALSGLAAGAAFQRKRDKARQERLKSHGDKYYEYFQLLNRWMAAGNEGKLASDFLQGEGITRIAVYGMGDLADRLMEDLGGGPVMVAYGIDRDASCTNARIADVRSPEDRLDEVDAIVVTPFLSMGEIGASLGPECPCRLIGLDEIVYSL